MEGADGGGEPDGGRASGAEGGGGGMNGTGVEIWGLGECRGLSGAGGDRGSGTGD